MSTAELIVRALRAASTHVEEDNSNPEVAPHVSAIHAAYREFTSGGDDSRSAWHKARVVAVERIIVERDSESAATIAEQLEAEGQLARVASEVTREERIAEATRSIKRQLSVT